ncbi:MAG: tRNA(Ile)(2)-agmatinylcytidine synthase [Methanosarcinaceae archaeon]|nr:tRNA(Ile)(2)-agmatinylcytidine synthase [Methanosarcinaceae archaeon]
MIIGIDDTDSRNGMCTTYLCAVLLDELKAYGSIIGLPLLMRLNPTIPYKTRGNASVAINIDTDQPQKVIDHVISSIGSMAEMVSENTNPGVAFVPDNDVERTKQALCEFFRSAVTDVLTIDDAKELACELDIPHKCFKNGRGLIGALAACGAMLDCDWDHTYEYIAYREQNVWGTLRSVDNTSLHKADIETYPSTWDTVDCANDLIVCVPRSPDPVLFGIRGKSVDDVTRAAGLIESEPIERSVAYRTNQGTDMHLIPATNISDIKEMHSYIIEGTVSKTPETIQGGHVILSIRDSKGDEIDCAAYEPTKNFRALVRKLIENDKIVVYGSVSENTLNIEKIQIRSLAAKSESQNPVCPSCGKRMKSAGVGQGYRCKKCKTTANSAVSIEVNRELEVGLYEVPPSARRHLAKPLVRFDLQEWGLFPSR